MLRPAHDGISNTTPLIQNQIIIEQFIQSQDICTLKTAQRLGSYRILRTIRRTQNPFFCTKIDPASYKPVRLMYGPGSAFYALLPTLKTRTGTIVIKSKRCLTQ